MPLTAIVEGKTIFAPDLSDNEWEDLKARHKHDLAVTMPCCGEPGHLRQSKNGLRHFYHAVDTGCHYAEESKEHLEIKYRIYRECQARGWETSVEYALPDRDWIADVYAVKDGKKIVFEIQVSPISPTELKERDRKYRDAGIESYWLLENFLGRSREFEAGYFRHLTGTCDPPGKTIPYLDDSLFSTGPENQIFIASGIRSIGLAAKKKIVYSTHNPGIPIAVWTGEVLKGNYRKYLERTAETCERLRRLKDAAAPLLVRLREFYAGIVRDKTFRKRAERGYKIFLANESLRNHPSLLKTFTEIFSELNWLENEYNSVLAESSGLFSWKKVPGSSIPRPFFRLEPDANVKRLEEYVETFDRWEQSFDEAMDNLEKKLTCGDPKF